MKGNLNGEWFIRKRFANVLYTWHKVLTTFKAIFAQVPIYILSIRPKSASTRNYCEPSGGERVVILKGKPLKKIKFQVYPYLYLFQVLLGWLVLED